MKAISIYILITTCFIGLLSAQENHHKIIFDFTKGDPASFVTIVKHAKNIMVVAESARVEVMCHGAGLDILIQEKTTVQAEIAELQEKYNVVFAACEGSMRSRGVDKSQLWKNVITVPLANLELSLKQQEGWSYIKSGN